MKPIKIFVLLFFCFSLATGMKCKKILESPNTLPAETQSGKNTFGFLLNGEVWVPKGGLLDEKLDLSYDPGHNGGTFNIIARRYLSDEEYQSISLGSYNINSTGDYPILKDKVGVNFNYGSECNYLRNDANITQSGNLTITRFDLTSKIISGTFSFKLEKDGCPTINATDGRFDMRIE